MHCNECILVGYMWLNHINDGRFCDEGDPYMPNICKQITYWTYYWYNFTYLHMYISCYVAISSSRAYTKLVKLLLFIHSTNLCNWNVNIYPDIHKIPWIFNEILKFSLVLQSKDVSRKLHAHAILMLDKWLYYKCN